MRRQRILSEHARTVLAVLLASRHAWAHGYELVRLTGVKSGTLYPLLIRLEAQGHLEAEWQSSPEAGKPPRHAYRLTATGMQLARDNPPGEVRGLSSQGGEATI